MLEMRCQERKLTGVSEELVVRCLRAVSDSWLLAFKCQPSQPRKSFAEFEDK